MVTIQDVARRAGVSPATVSRVFNGVPVTPAKVEAVHRAVAELGFVPNRTARALRTQSSEVVALVIPDIENPYFTELARGVEDVAQEAGYSVVLCNSDADADKEARYLRIAVAEHMAGVILAAAGPATDVAAVRQAGRPVIAVDRPLGPAAPAVDTVLMANRAAGRAATDDLLDAGFRRIACVTGPGALETARDRAEGWREAYRARSLEPPEELLRHVSFRVDGGRAAAEELASLSPDAYVAANNLLGVGVIQVLSERGTPPPAVGVAVVGSLPFTTLAPSAVTVVRLPAREMGVSAARLLLDRLAGDEEPPRTLVLDAVRASAARSPRP